MASQLEIYNMALSHLAVGKLVGSLTEASQEQRVCALFYETARDSVLRDHPWAFAKKRATLSLVANDPNDEWEYSYRVPSDCVFFRRVVSGARVDLNDTLIEYELVGDDAGELIYTDLVNAECEYTMRVTETGRFRSDFVLALSYRLAALVAPRLCGSSAEKLAQKAEAKYQLELSKAVANSLNESRKILPSSMEADMIRVRS